MGIFKDFVDNKVEECVECGCGDKDKKHMCAKCKAKMKKNFKDWVEMRDQLGETSTSTADVAGFQRMVMPIHRRISLQLITFGKEDPFFKKDKKKSKKKKKKKSS